MSGNSIPLAEHNGQNFGGPGNFGASGNGGSFHGHNPQRDTIMPLQSSSQPNFYQAGRLHSQQNVASSLHSSPPGTGDRCHNPSCGQPMMGQNYNWEPPRDNYNMSLGHSHAGAFNQPQNSWNHSGPPTDSSQHSRQRNTFRMESGAYDAGYRDAMEKLQRSLG